MNRLLESGHYFQEGDDKHKDESTLDVRKPSNPEDWRVIKWVQAYPLTYKNASSKVMRDRTIECKYLQARGGAPFGEAGRS